MLELYKGWIGCRSPYDILKWLACLGCSLYVLKSTWIGCVKICHRLAASLRRRWSLLKFCYILKNSLSKELKMCKIFKTHQMLPETEEFDRSPSCDIQESCSSQIEVHRSRQLEQIVVAVVVAHQLEHSDVVH
jgi:hypothetical protein